MRTVSWDPRQSAVRLIDQRLLPAKFKILTLRTPKQVADAIRNMSVRGAPAIGVTAAFGLALAGARSKTKNPMHLWRELQGAAAELRATRPTAVNLAWATERMLHTARETLSEGPEAVRQRLVEEANRLADQDVETNRRIGQHGAALIQDGDTVIHHCNTGALATVDCGTALGVIRTAHEQGKQVHVLVDETRPRLQGARLTAWELEQYGISYQIIADGAAGSLLRKGEVAGAFVGADRVAANGDVANKIGTYMLALAAHDNQVPFYCVLPTSTIDLTLPSGNQIPIEDRPETEVLDLQRAGQPIAPASSRARNPAFDITPCTLVTAFITEVGVLHPPFAASLAGAVEEAQKP